jgi:membrane-bound lytic murein transglycosylase D
MILRLLVVLVGLALMAGCGGGPKTHMVEVGEPFASVAPAAVDDDRDDALTEELSAKRLEELQAKSGIPGWDPSVEAELKNWEHQVKFDAPIHMNKQVRAYLVYFSTERKAIITRYLSRSTRYLPMIKEIFSEYGLPDDLAYLAMIESGFSNRATSHAAAVGMWQFIKGTAVRYGLQVNGYLDERRDPEKATRAAARYLLDLYKQFGSWYLAAASYNCGEGRVQRELNQSTHKNFWELSANMCLPSETKNYVPQMIAATIIAKNPEKFGFKNVPYQQPLALEKVKVTEPTSLKAAAQATGWPVEELQALNPELNRGMTPGDAGSYTLNIPPRTIDLFTKNIEVARIENPAVATRPAYASRSYSRSSYSSRKAASRSASYARKANGKAKPATDAAAAAKPETQTASVSGAKAAKASSTPAAQSGGSGGETPKVASFLPVSSAGVKKEGAAGVKTTKMAASGKAKGKAKATASSKGRKSSPALFAKKGEAGKKAKTKPAKKTSDKDKDKVSKSRTKAKSLLGG